MQMFKIARQVLDAAAFAREIVDERRNYHFRVNGPTTLYIEADRADVRAMRWNQPQIEFAVSLQIAPGWLFQTEQDEAGVYIVAKRRPMVGGIGNAHFELYMPEDTYLITKLNGGTLCLQNVQGTLAIAPPGQGMQSIETRIEQMTR
jgi:hypothetical protein